MDPDIALRIWRVAQEYKHRKTSKGVAKDGPYWFGYWMENGKSRRVYIGKELPKELQAVLDARFKLPGRRYFIWPGRAQAA